MNMGIQYKVSELMDNYTDNNFLIEQPQGADTDKILQGVKGKIKSKKHLRLGTKILIAAVAAVAVIFTITANSSPVADFTSVLGSEYHFNLDGSASWDSNYSEPYTVDGDKVFFTADGQYIDITDSIKNNNIYFYEYNGLNSHGLNVLCYIGVAGTINDLGYAEIVFSADFSDCIVKCFNSYEIYYLFDGEEIHKKNLTEEQYAVRMDHVIRYEDKPWWEEFEKKVSEMYNEYSTCVSFSLGRYADIRGDDFDV